jgi:VWFA-related protein
LITPLVIALLAPAPAQPKVPVFASGVDLVHVVVSATTKDGRPVGDLQGKDFVVKEEGKPRAIETFLRTADAKDSEQAPVDLVLLFDTSPSMNEDLARARDAIVDFVATIPDLNTRGIVAFSSDVQAWRFEANNIRAILDDVLRIRGGGTRFYDGILEGVRRVSVRPGRKAMVAFTDGQDSGSGRTLAAALRLVEEAEVTFYGVSYAAHLPNLSSFGDMGPPMAPTAAAGYASRSLPGVPAFDTNPRLNAMSALATLASATGGVVVDGRTADLASTLRSLRDVIAAQYVIGFMPRSSTRAEYRKLKIEVARKGIDVRHRPGYQHRPAQ